MTPCHGNTGLPQKSSQPYDHGPRPRESLCLVPTCTKLHHLINFKNYWHHHHTVKIQSALTPYILPALTPFTLNIVSNLSYYTPNIFISYLPQSTDSIQTLLSHKSLPTILQIHHYLKQTKHQPY